MFLFYTHNISGQTAYFDEVEMRHCINVLRKRPGDTIHFADGLGNHFEGVVISSSKNGFLANVVSQIARPKHPACGIHIAIAPPKNIDRFEWFLEKATEIGVTEITPIICSNSERKNLRSDRLEKVMLSAMKQCLGAYLPRLNPLMAFGDFVKNTGTGEGADRFIAHCREEGLPLMLRNSLPGNDVVVLIGPEGDFSLEEIEMAEKNGFRPIGLGQARLRTETAGIVAVHIINLMNS